MIGNILRRACIMSILAVSVLNYGCTATPTVTEKQTVTNSGQLQEYSTSKILTEETIAIDTPEFSAQLPAWIKWEVQSAKEGEQYTWKGWTKRQKDGYIASVDLDYASILPEREFLDSVSSFHSALLEYMRSSYGWKVISNKHRTITSGEHYCLEYETLVDLSPKFLNWIGYICPHPKHKKSSINISFDCTFYHGHETQECRDDAYKFFQSVKFK